MVACIWMNHGFFSKTDHVTQYLNVADPWLGLSSLPLCSTTSTFMDSYLNNGSRRNLGEYDDLHSLRRRTSPRVELSPYNKDNGSFEQDPFADVFGARNSQLDYTGSFYSQITDHDGLDTVPLTPSMRSGSGSMSLNVLPTPTRLPDSQRYLDVQQVVLRPERSRTESEDSVYTNKSASSSATVASSLGHVLTKSGLGVPDKFTNKWPKPLPLKSTGRLGDDELKKSVDAVLLENGIGGGNGLLGFEWFSQWTGFKWRLLFSVLSVLVYGIAGLSCAIGIWFRSGFPSFNRGSASQLMFKSLPSLAQCGCDVCFRQRRAHPYHPCLFCSRLHCSRWGHRDPPVFKTYHRYICSSFMAMPHFNVCYRLHDIQTRHICT